MRRPIAALALLALALAGCGDDDGGVGVPDRFDADRAFADLEAQVELGPRPAGSTANRRQTGLLASRLRAAGVEDVHVQRPWLNVVGRIPGTDPGAVLVGAHHDTKDIPGFLGANDGASGVAVVLEVARFLAPRAPLQGPAVHVALFDAEEARGERPFSEDGTRGSRQYVAYAERAEREGRPVDGSPPLGSIESMILLDMVGDCDLEIPREAGSDPALYESIATQAPEGSPFGGTSDTVLDDHVPFAESGIPAVDLIDFSYGQGPSPGEWWHTTEDTLDKVCPESLDAVGEALLGALQATGGTTGRSSTRRYP